MTDAEHFGERLAQERREKGVRERRDVLQKQVARAVGTTATSVSRWEKGIVMPGDAMVRKLAAYFGVTPAWLRYGQEPREAPATPAVGKMRPDPRKKVKEA